MQIRNEAPGCSSADGRADRHPGATPRQLFDVLQDVADAPVMPEERISLGTDVCASSADMSR